MRSSAELPDAPVAIEGWEPGLRLLADNLVENAARHGRPQGRIRVTLDAAPPGEDGGARLTVDDDGPGIADADRTWIFAPFARLESTNGEGSGLGLALVEQQVRHHGARIDVGESPLGGARFSVRHRTASFVPASTYLPAICANWAPGPGFPWIGTCWPTSSFSRWIFCWRVLIFAFTAGAGAPWAGGEYKSAFTRIFSFGK